MAEENTQQTTPAPEAPPAEAQNTEPNNKPPETWDAIFEHPRFKQLLEQKKAAEGELQARKKADKEAEEARMREQQQWQALAEAKAAEAEEARQALANLQLVNLRLSVAQRMKLPEALAVRLQGETEEEMVEDAKALRKLLPPEGGLPPTPPPEEGQPIADEERKRRAYRTRL